MGIKNWILRNLPNWPAHDDRWFNNSFAIFGNKTKSGIQVNEYTALNLSSFWACVNILVDTISTLPLHLYRHLPNDKGKERATERPLYRIFNNTPNEEMSIQKWLSLTMTYLLVWGNAFSYVERDVLGRVKSIWPLRPDLIEVKRSENGELYYVYRGKRVLSKNEIFHIFGLSYDGLTGLSTIELAKESVGLGLATQEFGNRFFGQGAKPSGIISFPHKLSPESKDDLKKSLVEGYQGLDKSHTLMVLEGELTFTPLTIPPDDAQFLSTRQFQTQEIARWFRVPLPLIQDDSRATFSNVEEQSRNFLIHGIRPRLVLIEQELNRYFLSAADRKTYFFEFIVEALLRGNVKDRYEAYNTARNMGVMNANEIRAKENMNNMGPEGDVYLAPMNMTNLEFLIEEPEPIPEPDPDEEEKKKKEEEERSLRTKKPAQNRRRLENRYKPLFVKEARTIVNKEVIAIKKIIKKDERADTTLKDKLEAFYKTHGEYVRQKIAPLMTSYADAINEASSKEIDIDTDNIDKFVNDYIDVYSERHIGSSLGQLTKIIEDETEEVDMKIEERLEEWREKRPDKIANNETTRLNGAIAGLVFGTAGYRLVSRTTSSKPCPMCQELNGKTIKWGQNIIEDGEEVGGIKSYGGKAHPSYHSGCSCVLVPGI